MGVVSVYPFTFSLGPQESFSGGQKVSGKIFLTFHVEYAILNIKAFPEPFPGNLAIMKKS